MDEILNPAVKRIGVLTSGGDAPGMNAAIRAVVRAAEHWGIKCVGIRRGWNGLISGDVFQLEGKNVSGIINRGGTMLYTARSDEFMTLEGQQKAAQTCKFLGIEGVVAIGGDGTFRGCLDLSKQGVSVLGIPASIDNDIACSRYSIGFDTACNTAVEAIDKLRDTMQSHERCSVVEVMGRHAGHIAAYVGLAVGATAVLVPEHEVDYQRDVIEVIRGARLAGRTHFIIVVAEGVNSAQNVADIIAQETGLDPRVTVLGHVQRGGSPTSRDRTAASMMGYLAVKALAEGRTNRVVCERDGGYTDIDMVEGLGMKKSLNSVTYSAIQAFTGA